MSLSLSLSRIVAAGAVAGTLGLAAVGLGAGMASADPGGGHGGPPCFYCQGDQGRYDHHDNGRGPRFVDYDDWGQRGIDNGRFDHRPFNYQGQRVEPYWDNDRGVWGFWFFGIFIAL